jgi:hypothetical protein
MLKRIAPAVASCMLATLLAQQPDTSRAYREFAQVRTMRVVCEHEHFGRVHDLVVAVPSGRLVAVVCSMPHERDDELVALPWQRVRFDAPSNLLHVGPCAADEEAYPPFDPSEVRITRTVDAEGDEVAAGTVLASRLAECAVQFDGGATGSSQGATIALAAGHIAFVHIAATSARAGDRDLHPAPWSVLRFIPPAAEADPSVPFVALAMDTKALRASPALTAVILQDPLYRAKVYRAFGVSPPPYDVP